MHYGTWEEIEAMRPRSVPQNRFRFGKQEVYTKVYMMVPRDVPTEYLDVASALAEDGNESQLPTTVLNNQSDPMLTALYDDSTGA